ncbi:MAG: response regulator, partial [Saprospiraceae bacterium]|nr:response regulator [Saprospiraceae bacterium]
TGIGLTLVSEMVRLMGGEISVTSRQGHGSTFTVTLPVSHDAPMEEQVLGDEVIDIGSPVAAVTAADAMTSVEGYASLAEVLVVEDNPDVIHYLTGCLDGSYRLRIAMDGQEGIEKAIGHVPDLVISDVMMPEKNGFELCETLKNHHLTSHIPIILLTARADAESRLKGLSRGADAYLEKPFNKEELLIRIEKLLELRESLRDRYAGSEPPQPTDDPGLQLEDAFIAKVRETLLANLDDPDFGIAEMCQALHIGRTQLHNKITALTGKSTSLYLRQVRLHASRTLLRDPNLNVSEVAYAVGFKDPKYFAKVFKQEYGVTPSEWS